MLYKNIKSILILLLLQIFSLSSMNETATGEHQGRVVNPNSRHQTILNWTQASAAEVLITNEEKIRIVKQSGCLIHQLTACACGKNLENYNQLKAHVKEDHSIKEEEYHCLEKRYYTSVRTYYTCPACQIPPTVNINAMCDNYKTHTEQTCIHQCPFCLKQHPSHNSLRAHLKKVHGLVMSKSKYIKATNSQSNIKTVTILGLKLNIADLLDALNNG